ncbi:MAG TPA: WhiB family transcriptional regulator [Egibacteraceae bacterium]|nr:WhiB family transcriptional regulator [Egibacteraceae bacterium]
MRDANWALRAACRGQDVELFYSNEPTSVRAALRICGHCPVRKDCFEDAVQRGEWFGVWGGLKESRRRRIVRQVAAEDADAA